MLSFPFSVTHIPNIPLWVSPFFERLITWSAQNIFHIEQPFTAKIISDSTGLYIHVFHLLLISTMGSIVWAFVVRRVNYAKLSYWFSVGVAYYLSVQLFIYGLNKMFKWQFYLPEPNTLFTTLGNTHLDILFWSTMGASYPYTVFSGIVEILPACLLVFKRTRLLGAITALGVMINVVLINFSFDISVKVFSLFLLLLSFILTLPFLKKLIQLFIYQETVNLKLWQPTYSTNNKKKGYLFLKTSVLILILFEVFSPYYSGANYNDDTQERPLLHGAYTTTLFVKNNDTIQPLLPHNTYIKRVFVHRRNYFIIQTMDDKMVDYKITYAKGNKLVLNNYRTNDNSELVYSYYADSTMVLKGIINNNFVELTVKKINLRQLPLLQKEFNWTIDGY